MIKRNKGAVPQLFNIKVFIYPGRAEIRGALPTQFLDISSNKKPQTAPVISSPSPLLLPPARSSR